MTWRGQYTHAKCMLVLSPGEAATVRQSKPSQQTQKTANSHPTYAYAVLGCKPERRSVAAVVVIETVICSAGRVIRGQTTAYDVVPPEGLSPIVAPVRVTTGLGSTTGVDGFEVGTAQTRRQVR